MSEISKPEQATYYTDTATKITKMTAKNFILIILKVYFCNL